MSNPTTLLNGEISMRFYVIENFSEKFEGVDPERRLSKTARKSVARMGRSVRKVEPSQFGTPTARTNKIARYWMAKLAKKARGIKHVIKP